MNGGRFDEEKEGDGNANHTEHHEPHWDVNHGLYLPRSPKLPRQLPLLQKRKPFAIGPSGIKRA